MLSKNTCVPPRIVSTVPDGVSCRLAGVVGPMDVPKIVTNSPGATGPGAKLAALVIDPISIDGLVTVSVTGTVSGATVGSEAEMLSDRSEEHTSELQSLRHL